MIIFPQLTTGLPQLLALAALSYCIGSIAFGLIVARAMKLGDIRSIGSGNIGATNVLRTGNKTAAFLTLLFDMAKGAIPVAAGSLVFGTDAALVGAIFAFLGHLFPVWLRFRGGKGVATFIGITLAISPLAGTTVCATWLAVAAITRISSVAALISSLSAVLWLVVFGRPDTTAAAALLVLLVWIRHRPNIARILKGEESKISFLSR